ncbi:MAG TPA: response regulator [Gammaproteobacteria bacterium]|nr:response regulator [Gammaproteobacteria bacterium]
MGAELQRILYVEDDPDIQAVARLALEAVGGFTVTICSSGPEAIREAEAFAPDLLILDVMMPGMDGPDTLRALRDIPALAEVPAIFMTAKIRPEEIEDLKTHEQVIDVVTKPFDPMGLPDRIREIWQSM